MSIRPLSLAVRVDEHEHRLDRLEVRVAELATKVGIYAALGAAAGGAGISALIALVLR